MREECSVTLANPGSLLREAQLEALDGRDTDGAFTEGEIIEVAAAFGMLPPCLNQFRSFGAPPLKRNSWPTMRPS
jgi:hypothetical protein